MTLDRQKQHAVVVGVAMALLIGGALGTVYAKQSVIWERVYLTTQRVEHTSFLPPATALRMSSVGYGSFWSDMLFIRTHAWFLKHMYTDRRLNWLDDYFDGIVTLDPDNQEAYYWAASVVRYGQAINEDVIARSNRFAEKGIERFPDDPRLYAHLGFNKYFELRPIYREQEMSLQATLDNTTDAAARAALWGDLTAVRAKRYKVEREALLDYTVGAMLPGSELDPVFLITLYVKQDEWAAAQQILGTVYAGSSADDRWQLRKKLEELGASDVAEELAAAEKEHEEDMPYVPEGLYQLLGAQAERRIPQTWDSATDAAGRALDALQQREQKELSN